MLIKAFRWLTGHLGSLLLALFLAIVVWVSAVVAADPNEDRTYLRNLEIIGQNPDIILVEAPPATVRITVNAPRSILDEISNNPALLSAWIDLTGLSSGEYILPIMVKWEQEPIRLVQTEPATVEVVMEAYVEKVFPITLVVEGETALGYQKSTPTISPEEVTVSGRESQVEKVSEVRALLDVAGSGETIKATVPLVALDTEGLPINDLTLTPRTAVVYQPISLMGGYKNVVVKVVTTGQIADGYRLTNISVSPLTVTVFSDDLQKINELPGYVETDLVDLTSLSQDVEFRVNLVLPEGVVLVGEQSVLVQVSVSAIEGNLTISLPVEAFGLRPELTAKISPPFVDVIVFGPLPVLDNLNPDSFRVFVDLTNLDVGTYQLNVQVDLTPDQVRIESIIPATVEVIIEVIPTPTPTTTPVP
jgi:YbbR domain-containing protein